MKAESEIMILTAIVVAFGRLFIELANFLEPKEAYFIVSDRRALSAMKKRTTSTLYAINWLRVIRIPIAVFEQYW